MTGMACEQIIFRKGVRPDDADSVRKILDSTGFFRPDEIRVAVELVEETLEKGAESGYRFLFSELDGEAAGYACYGEIPCTIGSYDLYWIAVRNDFQKAGIGRQLLERTESAIAGLGGRAIYIETASCVKYQPTRNFYLRNGYQTAAVLKDFYSPGDDKVIFVKFLAPGAESA